MRSRMRVCGPAAGIVAVAVVALTGVISGAAQSRPSLKDYAGTWVLDERTATGPDQPPDDEGRGGAGGGRGGGSGVSIGGMSGFGSISGPPDPEKIARHRRIAQAELAAPRRIVVAAEGTAIVVTMDDGRPEPIEPDGKRHLRLTGEGEITTVTRWRDGVLVSERKYDEGITAVRTYTVDVTEGGIRRLTVTLKLSGGLTPRKMPEILRVYQAM